jgi:hypothetical protein
MRMRHAKEKQKNTINIYHLIKFVFLQTIILLPMLYKK